VSDAALVHEAPYRVRFDEAGPDGLLRTSGFLRYAQDVAWLHSTAHGFDRAWYLERGLTWLVRAAELEILAPIAMGTTIVARTAVVGQKRVWARRRGDFFLPDGTLGGWVHTDWVMIDERGALTRIPAVFGEVFEIPPMAEPMGRVTLPPPPSGAITRQFTVRPQELDPMDHVNNAVYVDWLEDALLQVEPATVASLLGATPRRYRLEYAAAASAGAAVADEAWSDGDRWFYRLSGRGASELGATEGEMFRATVETTGGTE
jgi:acyl-ACP thioesterase